LAAQHFQCGLEHLVDVKLSGQQPLCQAGFDDDLERPAQPFADAASARWVSLRCTPGNSASSNSSRAAW
jgi:hypothetical protein